MPWPGCFCWIPASNALEFDRSMYSQPALFQGFCLASMHCSLGYIVQHADKAGSGTTAAQAGQLGRLRSGPGSAAADGGAQSHTPGGSAERYAGTGLDGRQRECVLLMPCSLQPSPHNKPRTIPDIHLTGCALALFSQVCHAQFILDYCSHMPHAG